MTGSTDGWKLVGECYVYGMTDGEFSGFHRVEVVEMQTDLALHWQSKKRDHVHSVSPRQFGHPGSAAFDNCNKSRTHGITVHSESVQPTSHSTNPTGIHTVTSMRPNTIRRVFEPVTVRISLIELAHPKRNAAAEHTMPVSCKWNEASPEAFSICGSSHYEDVHELNDH